MKRKFLLAAFLGAIVGSAFVSWMSDPQYANAATLTRGITFATNDTVTAAKLHSLVDSATISAIATADISDLAISAAKIAANAVTGAKILDATIEAGDVSNRTLTASQIATNTITTTELSTNLDFRANTTIWFTNANTIISFTNSTLAFGANQIPAASLPSTVVTNLSSVLVTNITTATGNAGAATWQTILQLTTTQTTGAVTIAGSAILADTGGRTIWVRLRDSTTNVNSVANSSVSGLTTYPHANPILIDYLTGTAKTYHMDVADSAGGSLRWTNNITAAAGIPGTTSGLWMRILQSP